MRRLAAFLIVLAIGLGACRAQGGSGTDGSAGSGTFAATGFASSTVALSTRQQPLVIGVDEKVLVFGGYAVGSSASRSLGDGALYDRSKSTWSTIPSAPFSQPLYQAMGVWTGQEAIILGTPCGGAWSDLITPECGKSRVEAAAFSPTRNRWRRLDQFKGPGQAEGFNDTTVLQGNGLGWTGRQAAFTFGNGPISQEMLIDPAAGGTTRFMASPDQTDATCLTGGKLVAVKTGEVLAGGVRVGPNPVANAEPLRTYLLDEKSLTWSAPIETNKPDSVGAQSERVICNGGQLVYLPYQSSTGFSGGLWWNAAQRTWDPFPNLKPMQYPSILAVGESGGAKVAWLGSSLFVLQPGASAWSVVAAPLNAMVTLKEDTSALVVDQTNDPRQGGSSKVGFLDPTRYLAAHR